MSVVKILERQGVIRLFGIALLISPFFNTVASMAMRPDGPQKWSTAVFWKIITSGAPADHLLYLSSAGIGLLMLAGSPKIWKAVLFLLGAHIFRQVLQLGENIRTHWIYGLFFVVNVSIFLFIADQLVWKQKLKPAAKPKAQPRPEQGKRPLSPPSKPGLRSPKRILIHFDGIGPWAQLMSISSKGILVRSIAQPPPQIGSREVEISVHKGLRLRTRLTQQSAQDYFFEYTRLSSNEVRLLNQWLQNQAA